MKRLYEKDSLTFSLILIGLYVISFSLADGLSSMLGTEKLITGPFSVVVTIMLLLWLKKYGLMERYGLGKVKIPYGRYLYFLPLLLLVSTNLWGGVTLRYSIPETVLYVISMIGVGILEELIFRGFLLKALCKDNVKRAVIISSLTFGIGHMVNLFNGAELLPTLLQIVYAAAAGFLFTVIFLRSGSLIPCIVTHCIMNSLSAVAAPLGNMMDMLAASFLTVISLAYAVWILKKT